jgi:fibronectin type 3 domain-containing protein
VADPTKSAAANVSVTAPVQHSASLNWNPSASAVAGYNVYRGSVSGGPYSIMNTSLDGSTNFVDFNVQAGQTLFYVVTSVETNGMESSFSNEVKALIP